MKASSSGSPYTRLLAALVLLAAAVALGLWFFQASRNPLGTQLGDLAGVAPADTQIFLAVDMRQQHHLSELVGLAREYPDLTGKQLAELEAAAPPGVKLEEMADWVAPAACMAWFPRAGQKSLLTRERANPPFEMAVVVGLNQADRFRQQFGPWLEKRGARVSQVEGLPTWEMPRLVVTIDRNMLVLTTSPDATARTLAAAHGKAPSLSNEPHYREALLRVEHTQGGLAWAAPDRMLVPLGEMFPGSHQIDDQSLDAFRSLLYAIATVTPRADQTDLQAFLGIDPGSPSPWARALLKAPHSQAGAARFIPGDWGNYHALNLPYFYDAAMQAAMAFPPTRLQIAPLPMFFQFSLGFTPGNLFEALTGEVGLSTHLDPLKPQEGALVLVIGLKNRPRVEEILAKLAPHIGQLSPRETVDGTPLLALPGRPNLRFLLLDQALLVMATRDPEKLAHSLLTVAAGKEPSLADEPLMKQALAACGENWVALNYLSMARLAGPVLEAMKSRLEALSPSLQEVARQVAARAVKLESSAVVLVDPQGLRLRTFGNGLYSQTFTLGMLGALILPQMELGQAQGQAASCSSNLKSLGTALEMYSRDHKGHYPAALSALTPNYLKSLPTCPTTGLDTYSLTYQVSSKPDAYTVFCQGRHHIAAGMPANHPELTSAHGLSER